jgi:diacylglycerol kinase (ATP)
MKMAKTPQNPFLRIIKAFGYSWAGLKSAFITEPAFRQELLLMVFAVPLVFYFKTTPVEKAVLLFSLFLILLTELINTAIEAVVDRISDEHHLLSKKAKDVGSALVLVSFLQAAIIWGIVLLSNVRS